MRQLKTLLQSEDLQSFFVAQNTVKSSFVNRSSKNSINGPLQAFLLQEKTFRDLLGEDPEVSANNSNPNENTFKSSFVNISTKNTVSGSLKAFVLQKKT